MSTVEVPIEIRIPLRVQAFIFALRIGLHLRVLDGERAKRWVLVHAVPRAEWRSVTRDGSARWTRLGRAA